MDIRGRAIVVPYAGLENARGRETDT